MSATNRQRVAVGRRIGRGWAVRNDAEVVPDNVAQYESDGRRAGDLGESAAFDRPAVFADGVDLVDRGWIEHVGVSNFMPRQLDEARDVLDAPIFAHQVEMYQLLSQDELLEYARDHEIWLVA